MNVTFLHHSSLLHFVVSHFTNIFFFCLSFEMPLVNIAPKLLIYSKPVNNYNTYLHMEETY